MDYTLISSKDLVNDYNRRYVPEGESIDESFLRSIADDTLSKIMTNQTRMFGIVQIPIKDFKGTLPKNYVSDLQAAYRVKNNYHQHTEITQFVQRIPGNKCHLEINVRCPVCHKDQCTCGKILAQVDVDAVWRMSNPEYTAAASKFFADFVNTGRYRYEPFGEGYFLMKRTTNNWFSMSYYLGECVNILPTTAIEYKIVNGSIITNFEQGEVVLAYLGEHLDDDGYKLVPNNTRVIEAIMTACMYAAMERKYYITLAQDTRIALDRLTQELEIKIKRARIEIDSPEFSEFISIIQNDWRKMYNPYYWYNAGAPQPDAYNPSNQYNYKTIDG